MTDDGYWFRPKRYGFGATPSSWQGWALLLGFLAAVYAVVACFHDRPKVMLSIIVPLLLVFLVITAKTTRGGWRWRWGEKD